MYGRSPASSTLGPLPSAVKCTCLWCEQRVQLWTALCIILCTYLQVIYGLELLGVTQLIPYSSWQIYSKRQWQRQNTTIPKYYCIFTFVSQIQWSVLLCLDHSHCQTRFNSTYSTTQDRLVADVDHEGSHYIYFPCACSRTNILCSGHVYGSSRSCAGI